MSLRAEVAREVIAFLQADPNSVFTTQEVADSLFLEPKESVYQYLKQLACSGILSHRGEPQTKMYFGRVRTIVPQLWGWPREPFDPDKLYDAYRRIRGRTRS